MRTGDGKVAGGRKLIPRFPLAALALLVVAWTWLGPAGALAQSGLIWESRLHYVGDVWLNITNSGTVGSWPQAGAGTGIEYLISAPRDDQAALKIYWQPSFEFPGGTQANYLNAGALAFGCIRGLDTLVSTGYAVVNPFSREFQSHVNITESSSLQSSPHYGPTAVADQQFFASYSDTTVWNISSLLDAVERRPHRPIGLEVHQRSLAWSGSSSKRFVIIDNWIVNISSETIRKGCIALNITDRAVSYWRINSPQGGPVCGFLRTVPGIVPGTLDTMNLAWAADNDGDPQGLSWADVSVRAVLGVRILRAPVGGRFSFNWWVITDAPVRFTWGPRHLEDQSGHWGSQGWPVGDRGLYRMMTNGEIDYDQAYSAVDFRSQGWSPPTSDQTKAFNIADGLIASFLLSFGPLPDIAPGDSVPFTYALIAGENLHVDPRNFQENFQPLNPKPYVDNLDFSDLILNARLADWLFDTPGEDTDGDGYRGKYAIDEIGDTVWYKGDGIPDWGGVRPPPAPEFELITRPHTAVLRWNGALTETAKDILSRRRDFEGYRVYTSELNVAGRYALIASWDLENYKRFEYQSAKRTWVQIAFPLTIAGWKKEIGDPEFDPRDYRTASVDAAYVDTTLDTIRDIHGEPQWINPRERRSYWAPEGLNQANAYWQGSVWEENVIQRVGERDTIIRQDTLTYGVYEVVLGNLSPAIPLYFAVTAFDHGDYRFKTAPAETGPQGNNKYGFILYSSDVVSDSGLKVAVYPNPYLGRFQDAYGSWTNYYDQGFEARGHPVYTPFDRRIWFANLPDTATIRIYSVDGDLIREIHHPDPFLTSYSSIVGWDLISRNQQEVESGIYIYRVDSHLGSQMGKFVIIK